MSVMTPFGHVNGTSECIPRRLSERSGDPVLRGCRESSIIRDVVTPLQLYKKHDKISVKRIIFCTNRLNG